MGTSSFQLRAEPWGCIPLLLQDPDACPFQRCSSTFHTDAIEAASVLVGEAVMLRRLRVTSTASEQRRMTAGHWPTKSGGEGGSKEQKFDQSPCSHRGHRGHRGHSCPRCGASSAQVPPVPPAGTPKWAGPGRTLPRCLVRPRSCAKRCDASRPLLMPFCHLESLPSPSPSGKLRILPVPLRSQPSLCGVPRLQPIAARLLPPHDGVPWPRSLPAS